MVFSSLTFLCIFLALVLILDRILPGVKAKNVLLLLASIVFYAYGEPFCVFIMLGSCILNYVWAMLIGACQNKGKTGLSKLTVALGVIQNLAVLGIYKYSDFAIATVNGIAGLSIKPTGIVMPIGISFFTFQAMSYVIDVYRKDCKVQKNPFNVMLYVSFFPQLVAGPIVKYHDIELELINRKETPEETAKGVRRFICGLSKKIFIANYVAVIADALFGAPQSQIGALSAWVGAIAYMFQIYFDFSAYSDMAVGLGLMFGFHFKENFNYPYVSTSIREFWRRWHVSLSTWFKEYLYIPLGGNRKGKARTVVNKFIVFLATGIWHGANWTFIFWGLYHGVFQMIEEYLRPLFGKGRKDAEAKPNPVVKGLGHIYAVLVVMVGFVFFRADTLSQGFFWVKEMFAGAFMSTPKIAAANGQLLLPLMTPLNICVLIFAAILSAPVKDKLKDCKPLEKLSWAVTPILLILCIMNLAGGTYNPFIYFRF
ncbi:MAG: MBOAT family protein [Clostridiales bacterium]|nr:MBOAT family protein [Clostridiales bacterium]